MQALEECAIIEVRRFIQLRCGWFDFATIDTVDLRGFPNAVIYKIPNRERLIEAISGNETSEDVAHLHAIVAAA